MYSLPFFGTIGGIRLTSTPSLYEYLNATNISVTIDNPIRASSSDITVYTFYIHRRAFRNINTTSVTFSFVNVSNTTSSDIAPQFTALNNPETFVFAPGVSVLGVTIGIVGGAGINKSFALQITKVVDSDGGLVLVENVSTVAYYGYALPLALNAVLWLDASDATTISATNNFISQWRDKSGFNRHANQTTGSSQPSVVSSGISFAGSKFFDLNFAALTGSLSLFIVHNFTLTSGRMIMFSDNWEGYSYVAENSTNSYISGNFGTPTYYKNDVLQSWNSRAAVYNALLNQISIVSAINCTMSTFNRIAGYTAGQGWIFNDNIYEIVIIPGIISTENRNLLTGYLAAKWGLTANLPAGHPYKP